MNLDYFLVRLEESGTFSGTAGYSRSRRLYVNASAIRILVRCHDNPPKNVYSLCRQARTRWRPTLNVRVRV